eukprot:superscaffoldBa00001036_g8629
MLLIAPHRQLGLDLVSTTPSISTTVQALRPEHHTGQPYRPASSSLVSFCTVNTAKKFVMEAQLRQRALGQSLAGPA